MFQKRKKDKKGIKKRDLLKRFKSEIKPSRPKRIIKRPQHHFDGASYDPFRLVPLEHYDDEYPAPFIVDITSDALVTNIFFLSYSSDDEPNIYISFIHLFY